MRRSVHGVLGTVIAFAALAAAPSPAGAEDRMDAPRPSPPAQPGQPVQPMQPGQPMQPAWGQPAPYQPQPPPWVQPGQPYGQPYNQPYVPRQVGYEMKPRYGLAIAGFSIFGGLWLTNAMFGAYVAEEGWFAVPVIGPWGYISKYRERFTNCDIAQSGWCNTEDEEDRWLYVFFALDGLAQAAGLAMGITGLLVKHKVPVYEQPRFTIVPRISPTGAGLVAAGTF